MMSEREMKWCYAEDGNNINICHNCGSKMEDTDHFCKTCGAGRSRDCGCKWAYGYKEKLQMYSVKGFCNKCSLEFSNIQAETKNVYCPR